MHCRFYRLVAVFLVFYGCATRGWVERRVSKIESELDENQAKVSEVGSRVDNLENRLPQLEEARRIAEKSLNKISQIEGEKGGKKENP